MVTNVYVDGFNLYFGALKGTDHKWLDLEKLFRFLLPNNTIKSIKYYTARVKQRAGDPDQPVRQAAYLRALETIPNLEIFYGHYRSYPKRLPTAKSVRKGKRIKFVEVIKTDEKGSDVNLATQLLYDAFLKDFEVAVVVSNDSDLEEPVRIVHDELGFKLGIINPYKHPSKDLMKHADFFKRIRTGALANAQCPDSLTDAIGTFTKPPEW